VHPGWMKLGVYLQQPDGSLRDELWLIIPYVYFDKKNIVIGDINNDGYRDVALAVGGGGLAILYNVSQY
jgi:hypothetical protein